MIYRKHLLLAKRKVTIYRSYLLLSKWKVAIYRSRLLLSKTFSAFRSVDSNLKRFLLP